MQPPRIGGAVWLANTDDTEGTPSSHGENLDNDNSSGQTSHISLSFYPTLSKATKAVNYNNSGQEGSVEFFS